MVTESKPLYSGHAFRFLRQASWPNPYRTPRWARNMQTETDENGNAIYRCFPAYLDIDAFADFLLLERCGWDVFVDRHPSGLVVTIELQEPLPTSGM